MLGDGHLRRSDLCVRIPRAQLPQPTAKAPIHGGGDEADAKPAGLTKPQGLGEVLKMVGLSDDIAGHLQQDSTAVRERDLPTRSLEQLNGG